jgi:HK97 family phage prohead protease
MMPTTLSIKGGGFGFVMETKATADGTFTIAGYASVFGNVDEGGDVSQPGSFSESLAVRPSVPVLWQHDQREPIGKTTLLAEDDYGLLFKARIAHTRRGIETFNLSQVGALAGMSYGYVADVTHHTTVNDKPVRSLDQQSLHEISVVTFSMNPKASFALERQGKARVMDAICIAEMEARIPLGGYMHRSLWQAYAEAQLRQLERMLYAGQTKADYLAARQWELIRLRDELEKLTPRVDRQVALRNLRQMRRELAAL